MKIMRYIRSLLWDLSTPGIGLGRILNAGFILPFIIVVLLLIVVFSVTTIEVTSQNFFCGTCHEMREHFRTWQVSGHKDIKCLSCHVSPGVVSMLKTKVGALRELYVTIMEDKDFHELKEGIRKRVPDINCTKCHKETENLIVYHSLKITHKDHWDRNISCVTCHSRVVHGPRAEFKNTPTMGTCRECHDGKTAPDECGTCHVTLGMRAPSTFDPRWIEAHKLDVQKNEATCKRCHHQDFCNNCHTSAKPHNPEWFNIHNVAAKRDIKNCQTCHKERYCEDCHKIRKEHSLNWINLHKDEVKVNKQDCDRCHKESFCSDCHTKFVKHPDNWMDAHGSKGRTEPNSCNTCHTKDFCSTCHRQVKHPGGWMKNHGSDARKDPGSCNTCHKKDFCTSCHQKVKHPENWLENHDSKASSDPGSCNTCHTKDFCATCHE